jgi:hypothetical protein
MVYAAATPAIIGLCLLWWLQRRSESNAFVLGALPLALFAIVAPVYPTARRMINDFAGIAETGIGGQELVASFAAAMVETLSLSLATFLAILVVAGALQGWTAHTQHSRTPSGIDQEPPARWTTWALPVTSVVVLPVAAVLYNTIRIARVVGVIGDTSRPEEAAMTYAASMAGVASVSELSEAISLWLVASAIGGLTLAPLLLALGIVAIVLVGTRKAPRTAGTYSWLVLVGLCIAASATLAML